MDCLLNFEPLKMTEASKMRLQNPLDEVLQLLEGLIRQLFLFFNNHKLLCIKNNFRANYY